MQNKIYVNTGPYKIRGKNIIKNKKITYLFI